MRAHEVQLKAETSGCVVFTLTHIQATNSPRVCMYVAWTFAWLHERHGRMWVYVWIVPCILFEQRRPIYWQSDSTPAIISWLFDGNYCALSKQKLNILFLKLHKSYHCVSICGRIFCEVISTLSQDLLRYYILNSI